MYKLDKNENNFDHHLAVKKALSKSASLHDLNFYPPENNLDIYTTLAKFHHIKTENLYLGNGLESVLLSAWRSIHLLGVENVILPESCWNHYYNLAQQAFFKTNQISTLPTPVKNNYFYYDLKSLVETLKENSKPMLVIITSPNNPTGHETSINDLIPLFEQFPNHLFFIDEAYVGFGVESYQNTSSIALINKYKNLILGRSFSKFFCCPGLRFGYVIASHELIQKLNLKPCYLGLRSITGTIVTTLIKHYDFYCQQAEKIKKSRDNFIKLVNKNKSLTAFNSSSNCVFVKVNKSYNPDHFQAYLEKHDFIVKLIKDKPLENCMRVSVAPSKILTKLSTLLNQYFEKN